MRWLYYLWLRAFSSGRVYGMKAATYADEKPIYVADLHYFLFQLKENDAPRWLIKEVEKEIKLNTDKKGETK